MTKQDATAGFSRFWVSRATPLTLAALLFAASCDLFTYKRPFPDAYYENNFIANIDFDENVCADGPATVWVNPAAIPPDAIYPDLDGKPVPVTGRWDLAYRYDEGWEGFNYITVLDTAQTASAYGGATGLVPNAPVYRVEVANLVQGGNFELNAGARFSGTGSWAWQHRITSYNVCYTKLLRYLLRRLENPEPGRRRGAYLPHALGLAFPQEAHYLRNRLLVPNVRQGLQARLLEFRVLLPQAAHQGPYGLAVPDLAEGPGAGDADVRVRVQEPQDEGVHRGGGGNATQGPGRLFLDRRGGVVQPLNNVLQG